MIHAPTTRRSALATALLALVVFDAAVLLFAGIVHLVGADIPLGVATFVEPVILPAGIVESLAGLFFVVAAFAAFTHKTWAWTAALTAHLFTIAGFLVGIVATLSGTTPFNTIYHRVMMAVFVLGLIALLTRSGREALGRDGGR